MALKPIPEKALLLVCNPTTYVYTVPTRHVECYICARLQLVGIQVEKAVQAKKRKWPPIHLCYECALEYYKLHKDKLKKSGYYMKIVDGEAVVFEVPDPVELIKTRFNMWWED